MLASQGEFRQDFEGRVFLEYGPGKSSVFDGNLSIESTIPSISSEMHLEGRKYIIQTRTEGTTRASAKFFLAPNAKWEIGHDSELGEVVQGRGGLVRGIETGGPAGLAVLEAYHTLPRGSVRGRQSQRSSLLSVELPVRATVGPLSRVAASMMSQRV